MENNCESKALVSEKKSEKELLWVKRAKKNGNMIE